MMLLAAVGTAILLGLIWAIHWSTSLPVPGKGSGNLCRTLIAIFALVVGAMIAIPIIVVPWVWLGGDKEALYVLALVFFGTVAHELTDISGSIKTRRYRMAERRIAVGSRNKLVARSRIFMWASAEYQKEFFRKQPRFWFRLISWSLLALAGIVLVNILGP